MNKKALLARRLREIRLERFGEYGVETLAGALNIPVQTWLNYERGVTMPAHVLLEFLELMRADARSMLSAQDVFPTIRID